MFWDNKKSSGNDNTLSDIARGIQYAVNTTQEIVEHHYQNLFERYFENNAAKMTSIKISENNVLEVPTISLLSLNNMMLDEMSVDLSLRINKADKKIVKNSEGYEIERASFSISLSSEKRDNVNGRNSDVIDITMKFKAGNPPEAVEKIVEEFTRKIFPKAVE